MSEEAKIVDDIAAELPSENKETKVSSIKPPSTSKIGRLCLTHATPKAGLPPPEQKSNNILSDEMSRQSEELLKSPLTDVSEENELDLVMDRLSRSSISPEGVFARPPKADRKISNGSMGGDLYLEATGRRRSSDHGVILTADTDSFIIGQKVWVGGIRPGQIAYIGETHFAPGEWAGVVLDEPNGKNDGCVSGKRYFQCEPKKGIFSRLTRLTHYPLPNAYFGKEQSPGQTSRSILSPERSKTASPTSSMWSSMLKSPSKQGMTVGDRIIVSSGLGSRPGILKYMGETKFAQGNWCGIQLDEPTGKNDGSVDGVRYFECPSKYGIFVPIAKVSLSPSSRKSRLSRAGSKESLTSIGTLNSVATTNTSRLRMSTQKIPTAIVSAPKNTYSLQDVIREKQNHIEQLMIERDLDREDAQNQAMIFQKNNTELKARVAELEKLLEDERKKIEDLEYTVDEAQCTGDELKAQTQAYKEKILEFQQRLTSSEKEVNLEIEAKHVTEVKSIQHEIEELKETMRNKIELCTKEYETKIAILAENEQTLKEQMQYLAKENEEMRKELLSKDECAEKLYLNIKQIQNTLNEETTSLQESVKSEEAKYLELLKTCNEKDALIHKLSIESHELNDKLKCAVEKKEEFYSSLQNSDVENKRIKIDLEKNSIELTKITEIYQQKLSENEQLHQSINLSQINDESLKKVHTELTSENERLKTYSQVKDQEVFDLTANLSQIQNAKDELSKELVKVQSSVSEAAQARSLLESELISKEQEGDMNKILIQELNAKLKSMEEKTTESYNINSKLQENVNTQSDEISKYKLELKTLQQEHEKVTQQLSAQETALKNITSEYDTKCKLLDDTNENNNTVISQFEKERFELSSEIKNLNEKLQTYVDLDSSIIALRKSLTDIQAQNETLTKILEQKEHELNALKDDHTNKLAVIEEQSNKLKDSTLLANNQAKECDQFKATINQLNEHSTDLLNSQKINENRIAELELENGDINRKNETLNQKCTELANQHQILQQELTNLRTSSSDTNSEIIRLTSNLVEKQKAYEELLYSSNAARNEVENELQQSNQNLTLASKEVERLKQHSQLLEDNKKDLLTELDAMKKNEGDKNSEIERLKLEIKLEKENLAKILSATSQESEGVISKLDSQISSLQNELNILEVELGSTKKNSNVKEESLLKQIEEYGNEKTKLLEELNVIKQSEVSLRTLLEKQKEDGCSSMEILNSQLNLKKNEIDSLNSTILKLQETSAQINSKLSTTESSYESLQTECISLRTEVNKAQQYLDRITKLENTLQERDLEHASLLNQNEDLHSKIIRLENDKIETIHNLESFKSENSTMITSLRDEICQIKNGYSILEMELKQEKEKNANLQQNLDKLTGSEQISDNLNKELLKKEELLNSKIEDIVRLNKKVEELQTGLNDNTTRLNEVTSNSTAQIDSLNKIITKKVDENTKLLNDVLELKEQANSEKEQLSLKLSKEIEQQKLLTEKYQLLTKEHGSCEIRISKLESTLHEKNLEFDNLNSKITKLEISQNNNRDSRKINEADHGKLLKEFQDESNYSEKELQTNKLKFDNRKESQISDKIENVSGSESIAQINFLNSIIADMQKKNETLKARINTLESFPMDFTQPTAFSSIGKRDPTPRPYCDICEEFDAHDTEDCPVQSSESPIPPCLEPGEKDKKIPAPRKYCETCEVFGHDTCGDEGETY